MPQLSILMNALALLQIGLLLGMFVALAWGLRELWAGRPLLPQNPPFPVPWNGKDVSAVVFLWLMVNVLVLMGSSLLLSEAPSAKIVEKIQKPLKTPVKPEAPKKEPKALSFASQMAVVTLINGILIVLIPLLLRLLSGATFAQVGFSFRDFKPNVKLGFKAFLFATPLVYLVFAVAQLVWRPTKHPLEEMIFKEMSPGVVVLAVLSAVIFAPIAEELMFRSVLQGWLMNWFRGRSRRSKVRTRVPTGSFERPEDIDLLVESANDPRFDLVDNPHDAPSSELAAPTEVDVFQGREDRRAELTAISITSALFALAHAPQMPAPIALFSLAMFLGYLVSRTGSLVPSIVLHACFNGYSTLGLLIKVSVAQP